MSKRLIISFSLINDESKLGTLPPLGRGVNHLKEGVNSLV